MARVTLHNVSKIYEGNVRAVNDISLTIQDKEFVVLVGPSGCGKSTALRMIAGLEEISTGTISIDDTVVNGVAPKDRDIAMVFQNYALYPHMSVFENLAFGLKLRNHSKEEIGNRVQEAAKILGIDKFLDRKPKALSGGQRQRVALGRAIVRHPKVFLFDEPLSNLDANLRVQMRTEISRLHQRLRTTMIYVTHDQVEAMSMGDRIVVMKDGLVQQVDTPLNLYHEPVNSFVAGFIGSPTMNFFTGVLTNGDAVSFREDNTSFMLPFAASQQRYRSSVAGQRVVLGIRPEHITLGSGRQSDGLHTQSVTIEVVEPVGNEVFVYFSTGSGQTFVARVPTDTPPSAQTICDLSFDITKLHFFDAVSGASLRKP